MTLIHDHASARIGRRFTRPGASPYADVEWGRRDAVLHNHTDGSVAFEQLDVEFPVTWSVTASNIVAQKYFRTINRDGVRRRESSLREVVERVAGAITEAGVAAGYFADDEEANAFGAELRYLLVHQMASFNSPVWFNIGVPGVPQQASACFILDVEDDLRSILNWYVEEGVIFKGGSGAGANLSKIRSQREKLSGGGVPSGPVSFMRGADASAGAIRSGGTTRRAAKMVILDADHPDIEEFVWCKANEERKARVLRDAGFDMSLDGADSHSVQYQNANNSVRLTDEFMEAAVNGGDWALTARTTGEVIDRIPAAGLLRQIAEAAWECADPGVQFDTTINRWNTTPNAGRIEASNPCSEHLRLADSACNLASINLLRFLDEDGQLDIEAFQHAVRVLVTAQDILVGSSDYPTESIAAMTARSRDIGLGYTNLGACLMALGYPYDSDSARTWAGAVTGIMTAAAAQRSVELAARLGPAPLFDNDSEAWIRVYDMHLDAARNVGLVTDQPELTTCVVDVWENAAETVRLSGARNAELTVAAPTGTISFMMDADTTGIEPDLGLVKRKRLVGGGTLEIVNRTVPRALRRLGYTEEQIEDIEAHIAEKHSALGAPHLAAEHLAVFACAMGDNTISYQGHLRMMAAIQPFFSGAMSKTVNVPESTTVEEIEALLIDAWRAGIKCVALYRDNCKVAQPLSTGPARPGTTIDSSTGASTDGSTGESTDAVEAAVTDTLGAAVVGAVRSADADVERRPTREKLPRSRRSRTFEFRVADCKGFVTVGEYDDGRPGELFLRVSKQGSTLAGIMDAFAIAVSHGLQFGVPLTAYVHAFVGMRFDPAGITDDSEVRMASSIMDYLFRRLALDYIPYEERLELGILGTSERLQPTLPGVVETVTPSTESVDLPARRTDLGAPMCMQCGVAMSRAGSCYVCGECGTTSGCS